MKHAKGTVRAFILSKMRLGETDFMIVLDLCGTEWNLKGANAKLHVKKARAQYIEETRTIIVKNLMTGQDVEILASTPHCCNPASETYWSM